MMGFFYSLLWFKKNTGRNVRKMNILNSFAFASKVVMNATWCTLGCSPVPVSVATCIPARSLWRELIPSTNDIFQPQNRWYGRNLEDEKSSQIWVSRSKLAFLLHIIGDKTHQPNCRHMSFGFFWMSSWLSKIWTYQSKPTLNTASLLKAMGKVFTLKPIEILEN